MNDIEAGKIVRESSKYVANWIVKQNAVKEESLTDWFLFDTSDKISCVYYKAFTRHEESCGSGADWEWWIIFDKGAIRFRVQAKKLDSKADNYRSLAYTTRNQSDLQIDRLISDAQRTNSFPLYAFYVDNGMGTACNNKILDEGVYVSGAQTIYDSFIKTGKNRVDKYAVIGRSIPVSCLFLCPAKNGNAKIPLYGILNTYFKIDFNNSNIQYPGFYMNLPRYVETFIKSTKSMIQYEWEYKVRSEVQGINSIVVYDFRADK